MSRSEDSSEEAQYMLDFLIEESRIVDGTGNPWFKANVGIRGERIIYLGPGEPAAKRTIDGEGLCTSPGFIDMHSHSDFTLLVDPLAESKIRQGVTTDVVGNCGISAAPVTPDSKDRLLEWDLMRSVELGLLKSKALPWNWNSMAEYSRLLTSKGIGINVAPFVGHGTIRVIAMGQENRAPTRSEMALMKKLLSEGLRDGAFGLSSGLAYLPALYSKTRELVELGRVVSEYGGYYLSHIRNEGDGLIRAIRETITIGRDSGIPVQVSHIKAIGRRNWGRSKKALEVIGEARKEGVEITADQYPYEVASISASTLTELLPEWLKEIVSKKDRARLKSGQTFNKMRRELRGGLGWSMHGKRVQLWRWEDALIVDCPRAKQYEGRTFSNVAAARTSTPVSLLRDILLKQWEVQVLPKWMCKSDVENYLVDQNVMIGSDGWALQPGGVSSRALRRAHSKPHPRNYGTFPRVIGRFVREKGILTIEDAVRKMTSFPSRKIGLFERGVIAKGMFADIVVFDPNRISDRATFSKPELFPAGITHVMVNGVLAIDRGKHTGALPGRVLTRGCH